MARSWAKSMETEFNTEFCPTRIDSMRQKQTILYGYALLAYTLGPLDDEAAHEICELIVLFRKCFLCASINTVVTTSMLQVEGRVVEMMTRRIAELVKYLERCNMGDILTGLVRRVCPTCQPDLEWNRLQELESDRFGSCFQDSNAHYAINLFTGVVLTDGIAPGGLPAQIRDHERFLDLFGRCNFEVVFMDGVLRTQRHYCDRLYEFALQTGGELFVQELTDTAGVITSTLQLCSAKWILMLNELFPDRLKTLYSHWYWVERNCVLFRPKLVKYREVTFVGAFDKDGIFQCYKVPSRDRKLSYDEILNNLVGYDKFVKSDHTLAKVLQIITKFEAKQFLHPLLSPENVLKIELPRFKLVFSLNTDVMQFESEEHQGYVLANNQQFHDFLPRFSRYLVLQLQDNFDTSRSELRLVLPVGQIDSSEDMVDVIIPAVADNLVNTTVYDVHRRLQSFETQ